MSLRGFFPPRIRRLCVRRALVCRQAFIPTTSDSRSGQDARSAAPKNQRNCARDAYVRTTARPHARKSTGGSTRASVVDRPRFGPCLTTPFSALVDARQRGRDSSLTPQSSKRTHHIVTIVSSMNGWHARAMLRSSATNHCGGKAASYARVFASDVSTICLRTMRMPMEPFSASAT